MHLNRHNFGMYQTDELVSLEIVNPPNLEYPIMSLIRLEIFVGWSIGGLKFRSAQMHLARSDDEDEDEPPTSTTRIQAPGGWFTIVTIQIWMSQNLLLRNNSGE